MPISDQGGGVVVQGDKDVGGDDVGDIMRLEVQRQLKLKKENENAVQSDGQTTLQSNGSNATTAATPVHPSKPWSTSSKQNPTSSQPTPPLPQSMPTAPIPKPSVPNAKTKKAPAPTWATVGKTTGKSSRTKQGMDKKPVVIVGSQQSRMSSLPQSIKSKQSVAATAPVWKSAPNSKPKKVVQPPPTWETVGNLRAAPPPPPQSSLKVDIASTNNLNARAPTWTSAPRNPKAALAVGVAAAPSLQEASPANWRDHKMSLNVSGGRQLSNGETAAHPSAPQGELWPSLGGGGGSNKKAQNSASDISKATQGSWGAKTPWKSTS